MKRLPGILLLGLALAVLVSAVARPAAQAQKDTPPPLPPTSAPPEPTKPPSVPPPPPATKPPEPAATEVPIDPAPTEEKAEIPPTPTSEATLAVEKVEVPPTPTRTGYGPTTPAVDGVPSVDDVPPQVLDDSSVPQTPTLPPTLTLPSSSTPVPSPTPARQITDLVSDERDDLDEPVQIESPAPVATMVTGGLMFAVLLAAMAFDSVTGLALIAAIRSLTRIYRRQKALEMELRQQRVIVERQAEVQTLLATTDGWQQVLQQIVADALPDAATNTTDAATEWLTVTDVAASPAPSLSVARQDESGESYTFTVSPRRRRWTLRRERVIPLDAALFPTARVEIQAVWEYLAKRRELDTRTLPRRAEWYVVVR